MVTFRHTAGMPGNNFWSLSGRLCKTAKSDYYLRHVSLSVRPHGTTLLLLENSSFIKTGQE